MVPGITTGTTEFDVYIGKVQIANGATVYAEEACGWRAFVG